MSASSIESTSQFTHHWLHSITLSWDSQGNQKSKEDWVCHCLLANIKVHPVQSTPALHPTCQIHPVLCEVPNTITGYAQGFMSVHQMSSTYRKIRDTHIYMCLRVYSINIYPTHVRVLVIKNFRGLEMWKGFTCFCITQWHGMLLYLSGQRHVT